MEAVDINLASLGLGFEGKIAPVLLRHFPVINFGYS